MKAVLFLLIATIVVVNCKHLFLGTNVNRPLKHQIVVEKSPKIAQKRIETRHYQFNQVPGQQLRAIQGILAVDMLDGGSSANVTGGGIGYDFVDLRFKSDRGKKLHYNVYIYV